MGDTSLQENGYAQYKWELGDGSFTSVVEYYFVV
jgi:hypothetical protein